MIKWIGFGVRFNDPQRVYVVVQTAEEILAAGHDTFSEAWIDFWAAVIANKILREDINE